jgi:pyrrolidone-carboxylate peptidase
MSTVMKPQLSSRSSVHPLLQLQQSLGNQAVQRMLQSRRLQAKLSISHPGDIYEEEADRVAEQAMRMPEPALQRTCAPCAAGGSLCPKCEDDQKRVVQRKTEPVSDPVDTSVPDTFLQNLGPGQPLDPSTRAFFEPRFGHDFSQVRVHTDSDATTSARELNAQAYTIGQDMYFAEGRYKPETAEGKNLLAHELTHTIQQRSNALHGRLMRRWDSASECASQPPDKWVQLVVIDQQTEQSATVHWSDGTTERDICSTGKGHCCVEPGAAEGGTCSAARSRISETNCTPVTTGAGMPVVNRVRDHGGVMFWSEIDPGRAIALHEYHPVDGRPLSHGCVRLRNPMAVKIFCGSRQNQTRVQIINLARPLCDHPQLQQEWLDDFSKAGMDLAAADGETRRQIRAARRELTDAFGRRLTPDQYNALTASDIPRCLIKTVEEERATTPGTAGISSVPAQILSASGFDQRVTLFNRALARAFNLNKARAVVTQHASDLWQAATSAAQGASPDTDDRPLYWARLQMMQALRLWRPSFTLPYVDRDTLLSNFESMSRGMESASFAPRPDDSGPKRVLISGFDPFGLEGAIQRGNPSGAAVLALDGRPLSSGGVTAEIQGVIFPVRYADFNAGMVESVLGDFLAGPGQADMIMTISQGISAFFEVEEWAGRRRSSGAEENLGLTGGGTTEAPGVAPGLAAGPEFLRTTLPAAAIRSSLGRTTPLPEETKVTEIPAGESAPVTQTGGPTAGSTAVTGAGGGFLSNEIFYRASLLRLDMGATIPVGHLHTPLLDPSETGISSAAFVTARDAIVSQIEQILLATLPTL